MASLEELLRERTALTGVDVDHLHSLVAEWALLADTSFADLLLHVPLDGAQRFLVAAQVRPSTGPTAHADDEVGNEVPADASWVVRAAWQERRIVREGEPEWSSGAPVRAEAIPVRHHGRVIAVLSRDTNLATVRSPSPLELAYLRSGGDLAQMVAEGSFPFHGGASDLAEAPRVGDGLLRVDPVGSVVFASPNALSAYRRLGHTGNVTGEVLERVHAGLDLASGGDLEVNSGRVWQVLERRQPVEDELEANGAVVLLRAIPLLPGGQLSGAMVLVRDVTELRRREAQLLSKDATIREIHHRVKNNLQTVAALLRLQARRTSLPEARLALQESVRRVTSIALVHETLSQTLDEHVAFDGIADELAVMTVDLATTDARATTRRSGSFGVLPGTTATPLALVLSELIQNAVEHAFAGGSGAVELRVHRHDDGLEVVVADNGAGLPPGFAPEESQRLGLQIVRALVVGEMRGTIALRPGPAGGTEAVVAIPLPP